MISLNDPLILSLVGLVITALVVRAIVKSRKQKKIEETSATKQEIEQLKLNLEAAQLKDKITKINQNKPKGGMEKFFSSFLKGSEAGRKARKEFKL